MERKSILKKNSSPKLNLSNIYTEKELESLKKIFPKLSSLIIQIPSKVTKTKNKRISLVSSKINQFIDKDKFVKLITEKLQNIFKGENSEILAKSIDLILKDNTGVKNEEKKINHRESAKITKNHIFVDFSEKPKNQENNVLIPKKIQKKNFFFDKCITTQNTSQKISSNKNLNMNNINNTGRNKNGRKIIDAKYGNEISDNKNKSIKNNSIINNFITFSNAPQTGQIIFSKNQINTFSNVCNNNINNSTSSRKSVPNSKNITKLNSKSVRKNISPFKIITSYLTTEKLNSPRNKNRIKKINTSKARKTDAYSINFVKKIEKLKTEINIEKINPIKRNKRRTVHDRPMTSKINLTQSHINHKIVNNANQISLNKRVIQSKLNPNKKEVMNIPDINLITKNNPIDSKDFNIFEFESKVGQTNTLLLIGSYIYKKFDFSKIIQEIKYVNWSKKIAAGYSRLNPYHTDLHASDVTQTCFLYLLQDGVKDISQVDNIDICSLILSCMCHDFKHGGLNNNFLRLTKDKLAIRYNDISILENMHISETFKLINTHSECDIFSGVDKNIYEKIRKKMISCVLSTDMAYHSKHLDFMKKVINNNGNNNNDNNKNKEEDKQEFLNLLIHSADISNPTKPFNIYLKWAKFVVEEFCQQGDKEKELGLVCTCDRNKVQLNKNQIGFIDYVVEGFNSILIQVFPSLKFLHDQLVENRENFVNYKDEDNNDDKKVIN